MNANEIYSRNDVFCISLEDSCMEGQTVSDVSDVSAVDELNEAGNNYSNVKKVNRLKEG